MLLERSNPMNRFIRWHMFSLLLLLALVLPLLAACGGSPQAAYPNAAPATAAAVLATSAPAAAPAVTAAPATMSGLNKINHVVVLYQENWSFDSLYGEFPGANGVSDDGPAVTQLDKQ